eukprot:3933394-Rhodomonas_salina.6
MSGFWGGTASLLCSSILPITSGTHASLSPRSRKPFLPNFGFSKLKTQWVADTEPGISPLGQRRGFCCVRGTCCKCLPYTGGAGSLTKGRLPLTHIAAAIVRVGPSSSRLC